MKRSWPVYILTFIGMVGLIVLAGWVKTDILHTAEPDEGPGGSGAAALVWLLLLPVLLGVHCVAMFAATPSWRRRTLYVARVPWSVAQAVLFLLVLVFGPHFVVGIALAIAEGPSADEDDASGALVTDGAVVMSAEGQDAASPGDEAANEEAAEEAGPPETGTSLETYAQFAIPVISAGIVAAIVIGFRSRGRSAWRGFGFGHGALWRNIGIGVAAYLAFTWAILPVLETAVRVVFHLLGLAAKEHEAIREYRETGSSLVRIAVVVTATLTAPVFEEIAFRGVLFQTIKRYAGSAAAIGLSALLFAAAHGVFFVIVNIFFLGLLFGYLFDKTGSIVPGIVLHFLFNATSMVALMLAT